MIFDAGGGDHEQVVFCQDRRSGLRCIIAIYSTALGPSLGGTRFHPYPGEDAALADVLDLSKAMAYKNAIAGLPHGGGKAVIIGDPQADKSPALLRAYGRFVQSLGGRYITACDVGTYVADMDVVAETCEYVTGRSEAAGGAGDSGVLTAFGVYRAMLAAASFRWPGAGLDGRRIGVIGIGKVGRPAHRARHRRRGDGRCHRRRPGGDGVGASEPPRRHLARRRRARDRRRPRHPRSVRPRRGDHRRQRRGDRRGRDLRGGQQPTGARRSRQPTARVGACSTVRTSWSMQGVSSRWPTNGSASTSSVPSARRREIYETTLEILELASSKGVTPTEAATHLAEDRMAAAADNDVIKEWR